MSDYDAIVIGAGHNGLTASSELARKGLRVLCLEKTNWAGGMAATKEFFEGYKHNVGAWVLLVFREEMLKRLGLDQYGVELIRPRSSYCVFGAPEDTPFIGYTDKNELAEHLMNDHGIEAVEGMARLGECLQKFRAFVDESIYSEPGSVDNWIARAPDVETREFFMQLVYGSAMDFIKNFFPNPEKFNCITGSLMASAIDGTHMGPYSAGSALSLAWHLTVGDEYDFKTPRGGIGALPDALLRSFEDHGGEIRYKTRVKKLLLEGEKVIGVETENGEKISANVVLSNLDARTTFIDLVGEDRLPNDFVHEVNEINNNFGYIQIQMTLTELPEFTGHMEFANDNDIRWLTSYIPSGDHLSRCWHQYKRGQIPDDPVSYCTITSLLDPSLASKDGYTCTIFAHYFPYTIPKGKHKEYSNIMADRCIEQIARYAPNFRDAIDNKMILTQKYFQNTFGITHGDMCHGLLHPEQLFSNRPVPGYADYKTPVKNLYMCGSSCHPGPGVTCVPGYNGANAVLSDW